MGDRTNSFFFLCRSHLHEYDKIEMIAVKEKPDNGLNFLIFAAWIENSTAIEINPPSVLMKGYSFVVSLFDINIHIIIDGLPYFIYRVCPRQ